MIRFSIAGIVLAATLLPTPSSGQDVRALSLDEALALLVQNNPELRVGRSRVEQATGLARQAEAFPNPTLSATHEPLSGSSRTYSETYLTASQRFELSGARGARGDVAGSQADAARHGYRADSLRLAYEVKRAYTLAVFSQQREAARRGITEVFRRAARSAEERHGEGDVSRFTLHRIRLERARYETLLVEAEIEALSAQRVLALLVTPPDGASRFAATALPSTVPPTAALSDSDALALVARRPEVASARAEAEAEAARARLMRAERVPDLTATGGLKRQSDGLTGGFFGLSLPLPIFDRASGAVEAADAGRRAAQQQEELTRRRVESEVLRALESYRALAARSVLLGDETNAGAGELLEIALVAYEEGEMELLQLLDAADAAHSATTDLSRLRNDLWAAYYDLERALGGFTELPAQEDQP